MTATMLAKKNIIKLQEVDNTCRLCHAKDQCMTSRLSDDDLRHFKHIVCHHETIGRGERLFISGDNIQSLFILHSGSVKSYVESFGGDNQITGFHFPGDIIGIHGIENNVHTDTVEALETSSVCEFGFTNFMDIFQAFPNLHKQLMHYLLKEMSHEQELLLVLGKMSAQRRIAHFLLDITSRLKARGLSGERFNLTMTRHDIANYLGLAVETVSRILTRLQNANIIAVERRSITSLNHQKLKEIYDSSESIFGLGQEHIK